MNTQSMWGFVDATLAAIQNTEYLALVEQGLDHESASRVAGARTDQLRNQVRQIQEWTINARNEIGERGVPERQDISTVNEVGRIRDDITLADEDLRMLAELAFRDREVRINSNTLAPEIHVDVVNNGSNPLTPQDIAAAVESVLVVQTAMHTNDTYL
jgi:hypothetical protein